MEGGNVVMPAIGAGEHEQGAFIPPKGILTNRGERFN